MSPSFKGIGFMCLGVLCLAIGDAISKWLGEVHSPLQIIFFRTLVSLPLIALLAHFAGGLRKLRTRRPGIHLLRGLIYTGTMGCFVLGLTLLPLAEATAIAFVAPLFVTLLSVPLLGERIEGPVLAASLVGFVGVLIVVRPGGEAFHPGSLVLVGAALLIAGPVIAQPLELQRLGVLDGPVDHVRTHGRMVYISAGNTFSVVDVSNPEAPVRRGTYTFPEQVWGFRLDGEKCYVLDENTHKIMQLLTN